MRVKYTIPNPSTYLAYYKSQAGGGVFKGPRYQRGEGLGSFFKSIGRFISPLIKPALFSLGKQAAKSGIKFASDVAAGRDAKESAKSNLREGAANLLEDVSHSLRGKGIKRTRRNKISRVAKKTCRVQDIFTK